MALSGILHTTPTPAAVEAWNLTHYTFTCRGPKAAHRAVEFYTEALSTPVCSRFSLAGLEETEKTKENRKSICSFAAEIHDQQIIPTCLYFDVFSRLFVSVLHVFCSIIALFYIWGIPLFAFVNLLPLFCLSVTNVNG